MTPERWQQIKDIFDRAVECPAASRAAFLREECGDDAELRREVESLLAADPDTGSLLDNPLLETLTGAASASGPTVSATTQNDSFGPYVPVRVLGEGGMGTVYLAHQEQPIRRDVALKVVKLGMDSRQVLERFESERQALALMQHPNVARVLDAGTSERGRPYFVMEYVDGVPVTQFCDAKSLSTRQRLQLFIPVCNALQHAHQKGIIHRDVKPSNILVAEVDGHPVPKVIDFGIARATDQCVAESEAFTLAGQIIGTPEYMSPEQADLDSRDIDTSTDVYSLGIVLYELLVGALPLDIKALRKIALGEVLRAIRETPVPKPTARITQMGASAQGLARQRSTDPGQLKRDLAGDLDCIVMKAIEKDRRDRYASASDFAADIERYLHSEPVLAGPPGAAYRMRKFVVRHKGPVAGATAVVLALIAGVITTAWQARVAGQQRAEAISEKAEAQGQRALAVQQATEASRQRDAAQAASVRALAAESQAQTERNAALAEKRRADNEAATALAVNNFLQNDLLAQASPNSQTPGSKPDPDLKVRTALDRAAARIAGKFDTQPLVEASIRLTIGSAYKDLAQYPEAESEFERALDLRRRVLGEESPETLSAMNSLGGLLLLDVKYARAEALFAKVLEVGRRVLGEEHAITLNAMINLGMLNLRARKITEAEALITKALAIGPRVPGAGHHDLFLAGIAMGGLYMRQAKYVEAERLAAGLLEDGRRVRGAEHPDTLVAMYFLAAAYEAEGKFSEAENLMVKDVEISRRVLGEEHFDTLYGTRVLATLYQKQGKYSQAELLFVHVVEAHRHARGEEFPETVGAMSNLAALYEEWGKPEQAAEWRAKVAAAKAAAAGRKQ